MRRALRLGLLGLAALPAAARAAGLPDFDPEILLQSLPCPAGRMKTPSSAPRGTARNQAPDLAAYVKQALESAQQ